MKMIKALAIAISLLMVLMMVMMTAPAFAVKGPLLDHLQYKFYSGQGALFTGLLAGDIDIMAWPLTYTQYQTAITTTNITVAPYFEMGDYEIAFNNNATDASHLADRKAMNYTEFRQALACLVDKDGLVAGSTVNGFATRIDTQVPRPILNDWVNFGDSKYAADGSLLNNYPWDYSETHALTILWNNGWYSHTTYPTLASLLATTLPLPANSVVYPPGHPRAGKTIDSIVAYIRSDHLPRKQAGEALIAEMTKLGIPNTPHEGASSVCYTPVFINNDYDFYTSGWSFGIHPLFWYSMETPIGIYPGGSNLYMVDDANMTNHATLEYPQSTSGAQSINEAKICQDIQVQQAFLVPLFTNAAYIGYRTGVVGAINTRGYGLETVLENTFLNAKVPPYNHAGQGMTLKYGTLNPPISINPIFSSWVWDYEVVDRIFNSQMNTNPYKPTVPGKSPMGADLPWMAYDWNYEQSNFTGWDNSVTYEGGVKSYTNMANVTYWFRHDITWHDGVPFTVDDYNYTIYLQSIYGDSWGQPDNIHVVNFTKDVTPDDPTGDWTCSVYLDIPTFWALYTATYDIVPEHIYKYIDIPADAASGASTSGLHGEWPGKDSLPSEILPGAPFTSEQLTGASGEQYVWIGTGMWQYVPGTYVAGVGGGLICDPNPDFWMNMTQGEMTFNYRWNSGAPPQCGSYNIGLADLVLLANAYGTSGNGHAVPFKLGGQGVWDPGCDIAAPAGTVGLSDLVTLAYVGYGKTWGAYCLNVAFNAVITTPGGVNVPISLNDAPAGNAPQSFNNLIGPNKFDFPPKDANGNYFQGFTFLPSNKNKAQYPEPILDPKTGNYYTYVQTPGGGFSANYARTYCVAIGACTLLDKNTGKPMPPPRPSVPISVNGITKNPPDMTPHAFCGLTGKTTFDIPATDGQGNPFVGFDVLKLGTTGPVRDLGVPVPLVNPTKYTITVEGIQTITPIYQTK